MNEISFRIIPTSCTLVPNAKFCHDLGAVWTSWRRGDYIIFWKEAELKIYIFFPIFIFLQLGRCLFKLLL